MHAYLYLVKTLCWPKIVGDKPKLLILNKADLADPAMTKEWRQYFESQGIQTLAINSKEQVTVKL